MSKTVTVQIGNTDDKLAQSQWAAFIEHVGMVIEAYNGIVHFAGGSAAERPWQNYCWVFELEDEPMHTHAFHRQLRDIADKYHQDSIAYVEGKPLFI